MKKHLLAIAALAAVSGTVAAQNVTFYGTLDGSVKTTTGGAATTTKFESGGLYATVWGLKGTEDLGGGLKAGFNLEGYFDTGTGGDQAFGGVFGRAANISVTGSAGTLKVGKQLDPAFLVGFAATDPRGAKENLSGLITWATGNNIYLSHPPLTGPYQGFSNYAGSSVTGGNTNSVSNIFLNNAVSYTVSMNGLTASLGYSVGGKAGDTSANSVVSLGALYTISGFTVTGSYSEDKGSVANDTGKGKAERWSVGAGYKIGDVNVKANYMEAKANDGTGVLGIKNEVYGVGVEYNINPANLLTVAYYDGKNKVLANDTSKTWIISNEYSFSKRTTLYGAIAGNKGGSGFTNAANMFNTERGMTNTSYQVGVAHRF